MENFKITKITLKPSKDMDVKYINEFLEKRISHGMDYFGKDKKLKSYFFFFFGKKIYLRNKHWKMFSGIFFKPNTVKYFSKIIFQKLFFENYFPKNILRQNKHTLRY